MCIYLLSCEGLSSHQGGRWEEGAVVPPNRVTSSYSHIHVYKSPMHATCMRFCLLLGVKMVADFWLIFVKLPEHCVYFLQTLVDRRLKK